MPGYTHTGVMSNYTCSSGGSYTTNQFLLYKPVTGMWACSVPSGFTYTATQQNYTCSGGASYTTTQFLLRAL